MTRTPEVIFVELAAMPPIRLPAEDADGAELCAYVAEHQRCRRLWRELADAVRGRDRWMVLAATAAYERAVEQERAAEDVFFERLRESGAGVRL